MTGAIECRDLVVTYGGGRRAVRGISFEVAHGEVLAILGPNGAGKTTTIECLEGYRRPTAGEVRVLGREPAAVVAKMGVMLQGGGLHPMLTPRQTLELYAAFYADPRDPVELLERLALGDVARTPTKRLSGGEAARLSLALALVGRPEVVFLDEPTAGVDADGRRVVREIVGELRREGAAVLLATHELDEAERLADGIVILAGGRVVAEGTTGEIRGDRQRLTFRSRPGLPVEAAGAAIGGTVSEVEPGRYEVAGGGTASAVAAWVESVGAPLEALSDRASLEDLYVDLVGEAVADDRRGHAGGTRRRPGRSPR